LAFNGFRFPPEDLGVTFDYQESNVDAEAQFIEADVVGGC